MKKTVVIHHPSYIPWLGYFNLIHRSDYFVFLDDVQYDRRTWRNRNRIRTPEGWMWLTVPVIQKGLYYETISNIRINNSHNWRRKHFEALRTNYGRAPFKNYLDDFDRFYSSGWESLVELDLAITKWLVGVFDIGHNFYMLSELNIEPIDKNERIIKICKHFGAERYLSPDLSKTYIQPELFKDEGIELQFQGFVHPEYKQVYQPFIPYMSIVDLLFNEGPDGRRFLLQGRERKSHSSVKT